MKLFSAFFLLFIINIYTCQDYTIKFLSGKISLEKNVSSIDKKIIKSLDLSGGYYFGIIQFEKLPSFDQKQKLHEKVGNTKLPRPLGVPRFCVRQV